MKGTTVYYKRLDYVRILACILVLLYHLNMVKGGYLAVCTFFTLSGYLGCISALRRKEFSLKNYYVNRFKKIYVPLIFVVSITLIIVKFIHSINWLNLKPETLSVVFGYNNFWQLKANLDYFTRHISSPFMHFWYISILMQYELVLAFVYLFIRKIKRHASTLIMLVLLIFSIFFFYNMSKTHNIMDVYYDTFARSFSLIFGVFLAIVHHNYDIKLSRLFSKYTSFIFLIYSIIIVVLCIFVSGSSKNYAIYMLLVTLISTRLIEYSTVRPSRTVIVPLKKMADISYEVYLIQYPVIFFVQSFVKNSLLSVPIIIVVTFVISYVINKLVNLNVKNEMVKYLKIIVIGVMVFIGGFILIREKDHMAEMRELEKNLNDNLKVIEKKNKEYMNRSKTSDDEWRKKLDSMKDDEARVTEIVKNLDIVGVGDSVFLDAINELYDRFPNGYFDGKISRTIYESESLLIDLKNKGKLSDVLIFCLATNGDYSDKRSKELMDIVGNRTVYWVNAFGADDPSFNEKFKKFAKDYPNIHFVPWDVEGARHPEYFWADKIHVKGAGMKAYADLIYETIYNDYLKQNNVKKDEFTKKHEEEARRKIVFYGNDVLTSSYESLSKQMNDVLFRTKSNYNFKKLYSELESEIKNGTLNHNVVLLFDKKAKITFADYKKIVQLCKDYEIYICNISKNNYVFDEKNVKVIDFYKQIKKNKNYLMDDGIHLSKKGSDALANEIYMAITKAE